jgi:hypothetical protein
MSRIELSKTLASLPAEWPADPVPEIQAHLRANPEKLVVIDDDPTGSQTVHDIPILTRWDLDSLRNEMPAFYILTNTRGMSLVKARAINTEIGHNLHILSQEMGTRVRVVSRSDSTLRGHFPGEVAALVEGWKADLDAWLIIPTLLGGGRYTIGDIHYVADGDWLPLFQLKGLGGGKDRRCSHFGTGPIDFPGGNSRGWTGGSRETPTRASKG